MLLLLLWLPGSSSAGIGKIGKTIANQHWAPHFPDQKLAGEIEACWVCKKMQFTQNMLWIAVNFLYTFVCAIICNHILNNVFVKVFFWKYYRIQCFWKLSLHWACKCYLAMNNKTLKQRQLCSTNSPMWLGSPLCIDICAPKESLSLGCTSEQPLQLLTPQTIAIAIKRLSKTIQVKHSHKG